MYFYTAIISALLITVNALGEFPTLNVLDSTKFVGFITACIIRDKLYELLVIFPDSKP